MQSIDELRAEAEHSTKRGLAIVFGDGKTWVIPTMPLKNRDKRVTELSDLAFSRKINDEQLIELVECVVKMNYPDANTDDINPDIESARDVLKQYTGGNLGN